MTAAAAVRTESARWSSQERGQYGRNLSALRRQILKSTDLSDKAKLALLAIAESCHWGRNPRGCFMSGQKLAEAAGLAYGSFRHAYRELEAGGWIDVTPEPTRPDAKLRRTIHLGQRALTLTMAAADGDGCTCPKTMGARVQIEAADPAPPMGVLREEEKTTARAAKSSSFPRPPRPESPRTATTSGPDQPRPSPRIAEGTGRAPTVEDPAIDPALLAALTPRVMSQFGMSADEADAKLRWAARKYRADWLEPAIASAERHGARGWGYVRNTLENFRTGDRPVSPAARAAPNPARLREAKAIWEQAARQDWILEPDGRGEVTWRARPGYSPIAIKPYEATRIREHASELLFLFDQKARSGP